MLVKVEKPPLNGGVNSRYIGLVVVIILVIAATAASIIMADSSKWDFSPTSIGTTV
jgi:hypothetical protein